MALIGPTLAVPQPQFELEKRIGRFVLSEDDTVDSGGSDDGAVQCRLCKLPPPNKGPCPLKGAMIKLHPGDSSGSKNGTTDASRVGGGDYYNGNTLDKSAYALQVVSVGNQAAAFTLKNFDRDRGKSAKQRRLFQVTWHGASGEKAIHTYYLNGYDSCDGLLQQPLLNKGKASIEVLVGDA